MVKIEPQRDYEARIRAVVDEAAKKAENLNETARRFAYCEGEEREKLFLRILQENTPAQNIIDFHRVEKEGLREMSHTYSFMQVAQPKVIECPIGAIELIDIYTRSNYRSTAFCLFEMEPNGDLRRKIGDRIISITGKDMPHLDELIHQLGIIPLFNTSIVEGNPYTDRELLSVIQKFRG